MVRPLTEEELCAAVRCAARTPEHRVDVGARLYRTAGKYSLTSSPSTLAMPSRR